MKNLVKMINKTILVSRTDAKPEICTVDVYINGKYNAGYFSMPEGEALQLADELANNDSRKERPRETASR